MPPHAPRSSHSSHVAVRLPPAHADPIDPAHRPGWFNSAVDKDTGERVWQPKRTAAGEIEYWAERERAHGAGGQWANVVSLHANPLLFAPGAAR